jgi:hypothetical protein
VGYSKGKRKRKVNSYQCSEKTQINNRMIHSKLLEKQEQGKSQITRWEEILKIRTEINEMENKRAIQRNQ